VLATAVAVVVLYVVGVVQWLLRGRRDEATTVIVIRMSDPAMVSDASGAARRLVEPGGDVIIHEIASDKASIQVTVEPKLADGVMVRLRALSGVERVTRVDG
jgi:hypothetical protein